MNCARIKDELKKIIALTDEKINPDDIFIEELPNSHTLDRLPSGKMAIYMFFLGNQCLKIGKVGSKSNARYTSQHYNPKSSKSNLAKTILSIKNEYDSDLSESNIAEWIKKNTNRVNILIDSKFGIPLLSLIEVFLQYKFPPKFEGFKSQK